jgi:hypothetical protein
MKAKTAKQSGIAIWKKRSPVRSGIGMLVSLSIRFGEDIVHTGMPGVQECGDNSQDVWWSCQKESVNIVVFESGHDSSDETLALLQTVYRPSRILTERNL